MKGTLIIIFLFHAVFSIGQQSFTFFGKVMLCDSKIIGKIYHNDKEVKNKLVYSYSDDKEATFLIAQIHVYHHNTLVQSVETDTTGRFIINDVDFDNLDFQISINEFIKKDFNLTSIDLVQNKYFIFCLSDSIWQKKVNTTLRNKIGYSAEKAKEDIKNGNIYFLNLIPGDGGLNNTERKYLENLFGFKYIYASPEVNDYELLYEVENEYNSVMFEYLDSTCNCNFYDEYKNEAIKLIRNRHD